MIGDNPAGDIRGANSAGAPWVSVLVRTGLFKYVLRPLRAPLPWLVGAVRLGHTSCALRRGRGNDEADPAAIVVDDVGAAVSLILEKHRVQ